MELPPYRPNGTHTKNVSLSSVQSITLKPTTSGLLVQAISQNIRYTVDNVTQPTTSLGFRLSAGADPIIIPVLPGTTVYFLQEAATAELQYLEVQV